MCPLFGEPVCVRDVVGDLGRKEWAGGQLLGSGGEGGKGPPDLGSASLVGS